MSLSVFDPTPCQLGEAAAWHDERRTFMWLDILGKKLFEKKEDAESATVHSLNVTATALICTYSLDETILVTESGLFRFNHTSIQLGKICDLPIGTGFRTNDAGTDPFGNIVFGVMEWEPTGLNGGIYRVSPHGGNSECIFANVGIPNTFAWSDDGSTIFFADSFRQTMYTAKYGAKITAPRPFFSLEHTNTTPDGSHKICHALATAEWDGSRVTARSLSDATEIGSIALPVPRPTSCALGGHKKNKLLITSAIADLSEGELASAPLSGQTFIADVEALNINQGQAHA